MVAMTNPVQAEKSAIPAQMPEQTSFTARDFRNAMSQFATGVVVITVDTESGVHAMTANAFMSGSLEPPMVLVSVAHTARMHSKIHSSERFGISVLAHSQEEASNHFAGRPLDGAPPQFELLGDAPVVAGAIMQLSADLRHAYPCGDHTLFVGEVTGLTLDEEHSGPLLFHGGRYGRLSRPE